MPAPTYVIVNADDLGYDENRDTGIVSATYRPQPTDAHLKVLASSDPIPARRSLLPRPQCQLHAFRSGVVTSASVMANGSSAEASVARARAAGLPLGVHINVTEGVPVCDPTEVPSLVCDAADGSTGPTKVMRGKFGFREAVASGEITSDDLMREMRAQLAWFTRVVGAPPLHVDGHMHIHVIPRVAEVFAQCCAEAGAKCTRLPQEGLDEFTWLSKPRVEFYGEISSQCESARDTFAAAGLWFPTMWIGYGVMGEDMSHDRLKACLAALPAPPAGEEDVPRCVEVMAHPGWKSSEAGGCGEGPDEFALSDDRGHEVKMLSDPDFVAWLGAHESLKLASYQEALDACGGSGAAVAQTTGSATGAGTS